MRTNKIRCRSSFSNMKLVVILACVLCISVGKHFFTLLLIKGFFMGRKQLFIGKPMEGPLSSDQLHESH